jgi:hypothetical protein
MVSELSDCQHRFLAAIFDSFILMSDHMFGPDRGVASSRRTNHYSNIRRDLHFISFDTCMLNGTVSNENLSIFRTSVINLKWFLEN